MPVLGFPDPRESTPEGIVAIGGDLHPETLLLAYRSGIFPWPHPGLPLLWFCPPRRGVLEFSRLHVPRSLAQARCRSRLRFTLDKAFPEVLSACARAPRPGQGGTWITPEMISAYVELHRLGHAHSAEAWSGERLVGGIYGVDAGGAFSGESMFYLETNASKLALLHLVEHLRARGLSWMDIQMVTPHMKALGAAEVPRDAFLKKLERALGDGRTLF